MEQINVPVELKEAYNNRGIGLVLGAGVSLGSRIPTWDELLKRMVKKYIDREDRNLFSRLKNSGVPLPVIASLIEEHSETREEFIQRVRDMLYANFPFYGIKVNKKNHWSYIRFVREGFVPPDYRKGKTKYTANPTLRSVGALCLVKKKKKKSIRFIGNTMVRAVATLNVDALLQTYVNALSRKHLMRTVEQPSADPYPDQINLYHMHGFLHYFKDPKDTASASLEEVVFTEQDYYDFFNQPNRIFNYTFLYMLREYSCLFIGLSMQDENIRRLLHTSKWERVQALSLEKGILTESLKKGKITSEQKEMITNKVMRHFAILKHTDDLPVDQALEDTLDPLGVRVIWIQSFDEIPLLLKDLYESKPAQKGKWRSVYGREKKI